jgi:hypothetical protein
MARRTEADREAALQRHWKAERELFNLKPWQVPPVLAVGEPDDPASIWGQSWALARERRRKILERDPDHYRDVDFVADPAPPATGSRPAFAPNKTGWMQDTAKPIDTTTDPDRSTAK